MKNLTLIFAFIIGTSFALSAQRGGLNNNPNVNSNSSIKNGKINSNPNIRTNTSNRNGSSYGRNGSTRPGSNGTQAGRGGNRGGGHYGNGHGNNGHNHGNGHGAGHNNHYNNNHHGHNNGHGHHNHHNGHGHNNGHGHHNGHGHTTVVVNHHGHHYNGYCSYSNHNFGWRPVCTSVYNTGCNTIWACGFDSDRLRAAKRFVRNNYVNSHQIAHIMSAFSFESSRLAFAKYAFNRTCDVQNYGQVFDQLAFNSSRRELDCFIQNYYW